MIVIEGAVILNNLQSDYKKMLTIRCFEQKILELFSQNKVSGTTHTYIGQEAIAVAAMNNIEEDDIVFSNHRCHGHYLAYGGPMELLLGEILSKKSGMCEGRGGSQHIHYRNFYTNGIQGGIVPNAMGMAWAEKLNGTDNIAVVFIGDGTLGQGVVYETFNMASLYSVPILFVVENNQYAMSTKTSEAVSGNIKARAESFGINCNEVYSNDVEVLNDCFKKAVSFVRENKRPFCQIVHTYRLGAHSKGDDTRDPEEIEKNRKNDPLIIAGAKLDADFCEKSAQEINAYINDLVEKIEKEPSIEISKSTLANSRSKNINVYNTLDIRGSEGINQALDELLCENKDIILIGEDIRDPYGGAFKVTKNLSSKYDEQVINTPISESAMIGVGVGLAMNGKIPVIEIMFGDFITLGFDQLLNHATKYSWIYGNEVSVPLVVRTPMGGGRGYGPTHSQSLEKFLIGIPLITIMALSPVHNIYGLYKYALSEINSPLIIIENKKLYAEKLLKCSDGKIQDFFVEEQWNDIFPTIKLTLDPESMPDITLITYGGTVRETMDAALELLLEDEIQVDVIVLSQISPIPVHDLAKLLTDSISYVGIVEEGTLQAGVGAEILSVLIENKLAKNCFRIAADNLPIPNGVVLEQQVLPTKEKIKEKIRSVL